MTDNEKSSATAMSDNEIIKALVKAANADCNRCSFNNENCDGEDCDKYIAQKILNIINRRQAEKEALIAGQETLQKDLTERDKEIERLNDALINKCIYLSDDETKEYCVNGPCPNFKTEAEIKAEAIKEFAERLKKSSRSLYPFSDEPIIDCKDVDNLVKEMVGESNV